MSRLGNGRIEDIAAKYGCKISIQPSMEEGDILYATFGIAPNTVKQARICRAYYASHVDLQAVHTICQTLTGKVLMQFWTGASEVKS